LKKKTDYNCDHKFSDGFHPRLSGGPVEREHVDSPLAICLVCQWRFVPISSDREDTERPARPRAFYFRADGAAVLFPSEIEADDLVGAEKLFISRYLKNQI